MKSKPIDSIWTDEQWQAICTTGTNILVSAGAGSGKTAVLTERISEKIKDGIKLEQLIVLTFTNAAAAEMKERVRKKLMAIADQNENARLELENIDNAYICTFDAFSMQLVKKYHYLLNVGKDLAIIDTMLIVNKRKQIIKEVLNERLKANNQATIELLNKYTATDSKDLESQLSNLINSQQLILDQTNIEDYYQEAFLDQMLNKYFQQIIVHVNNIISNIDKLRLVNEEGKLDNFLSKVDERFFLLVNSRDYANVKNSLVSIASSGVNYPRLPNKSGPQIKFLNDDIKKSYTELTKLCKYDTIDDLKATHTKTHDFVAELADIVEEVQARLLTYKYAVNSFEFMDINKFAISLLKNNPDIAKLLKTQTNEIMIDEYQDTSDIQEYFINLIANDNVYMVGDIKQSIYRFRNANPAIFQKKYLAYQQNDGGLLIDLNKNFRSRPEVLTNINTVFEQIMDLEIGGIDYDDGQKLKYGNKTFENRAENQAYDMEIITYSKKELTESKIDPTMFEIIQIAKDIKQKMTNNYQSLAGSDFRAIKYSDFAILIDRRSNFKLFQQVFDYYQIPLNADTNVPFVHSQEIILIKNIFGFLICLEDIEYARNNLSFNLMAIGRSYICDYTDQELHETVTTISKLLRETTTPEQLHFILEQSPFAPTYQLIIQCIAENHDEPIANILLALIEKLGIIEKLIFLPQYKLAESRINYLCEICQKLDNLGYELIDVVNYLHEIEMKNNKLTIDIEFSSSTPADGDAVTLTTIHKSKGLEYHYCYFPMLNKDFQMSKNTMSFDAKFGYVIPMVNKYDNFENNFLRNLIKSEEVIETISESMRLFYVALTRAKEQVVLIYDEDKANELVETSVNVRQKIRNFANMLDCIHPLLKKYTKYPLEVSNDEIKKIMANRITTSLHFETNENNINYYQIDNLYKKAERSKASIVVNQLIDSATQSKMEIGTDIHQQLEFINFLEIDDEIEQATGQVKNVLTTFKKQSFMDDIVNYFTEYVVNYEDNGIIYTIIIDLIIETSDSILVIDYKLSDIEKPEYETQVKVYMQYLEKISNKKVEGYLFSINKQQFKQIK